MIQQKKSIFIYRITQRKEIRQRIGRSVEENKKTIILKAKRRKGISIVDKIYKVDPMGSLNT